MSKWETEQGLKIEVSDMTTSHLQNTIRFLNRKAKFLREELSVEFHSCPAPTTNGALDAWESEERWIEKASPEEIVEKFHPIIIEMKAELERRRNE